METHICYTDLNPRFIHEITGIVRERDSCDIDLTSQSYKCNFNTCDGYTSVWDLKTLTYFDDIYISPKFHLPINEFLAATCARDANDFSAVLTSGMFTKRYIPRKYDRRWKNVGRKNQEHLEGLFHNKTCNTMREVEICVIFHVYFS